MVSSEARISQRRATNCSENFMKIRIWVEKGGHISVTLHLESATDYHCSVVKRIFIDC